MTTNKGEVRPVNKLKLSINGKDGRIRIGWGVADILHDSQYLSIYMSPENDSIMVRPCDEKEFLSIKVVNRKGLSVKKELRIQSLSFVTFLFNENRWDYGKTYHLTGEYVERYNAVVFGLKNAMLI